MRACYRALADLEKYFLLLAALEYNYYVLAKQQRVLEMMVSLTAEVRPPRPASPSPSLGAVTLTLPFPSCLVSCLLPCPPRVVGNLHRYRPNTHPLRILVLSHPVTPLSAPVTLVLFSSIVCEICWFYTDAIPSDSIDESTAVVPQ